jgi:hypothetical protein
VLEQRQQRRLAVVERDEVDVVEQRGSARPRSSVLT